MEGAVTLSVPLEVKLSVGASWGSMQPYHPGMRSGSSDSDRRSAAVKTKNDDGGGGGVASFEARRCAVAAGASTAEMSVMSSAQQGLARVLFHAAGGDDET
jgi:hypothetical protein